MMSAFGGPPFPRITLTPLVASTCSAEAMGGAMASRTLAVVSRPQLSAAQVRLHLRQRKRLAVERRIASRNREEADRYRNSRSAC
jgi:hypothetical protein